MEWDLAQGRHSLARPAMNTTTKVATIARMVVLAVDNPKSGEAQGREPLICGQIWREKEKGIEALKEDLEAWDLTVAMDHNSGDNSGAATVKEEMSDLA
ncbi:hypothetical protein NL676_025877 [Syzygium grande]|nr:hypothetical protein NL676_025877 [Syzygium grande]